MDARPQFSERMLFAISTALTAGNGILMKRYGTLQNLEYKLINNFRSEVDLESDRYITAQIRAVFPGDGIYSEESDPDKLDAEYVWFVDPIDGTIPYVRRLSDHFSVCIACGRGGMPFLGVTFCPARDLGRGELYFAEDGLGAWLAPAGELQLARRLHVSEDDDLHHVVVGLDPGKAPGRTILPREVEAALVDDDGVTAVSQHVCASVSIALVASGQMNAYAATKLAPEDAAAGSVIVREAGGLVTALDGRPWNVWEPSVLMAYPALHAKLLERLAKKDGA